MRSDNIIKIRDYTKNPQTQFRLKGNCQVGGEKLDEIKWIINTETELYIKINGLLKDVSNINKASQFVGGNAETGKWMG